MQGGESGGDTVDDLMIWVGRWGERGRGGEEKRKLEVRERERKRGAVLQRKGLIILFPKEKDGQKIKRKDTGEITVL